MTEDLRIIQLLCSRLCHDLVGPVGAINNGVELIGDAPDMLEDTLSLRRRWTRGTQRSA
jgi:histidine phosphotransferase ChpT